jgi:hypothetical protein
VKQVHEIIQRVNSGQAMTVAELHLAASALDSCVSTQQMELHVARVQIAFELERLGRLEAISGAA